MDEQEQFKQAVLTNVALMTDDLSDQEMLQLGNVLSYGGGQGLEELPFYSKIEPLFRYTGLHSETIAAIQEVARRRFKEKRDANTRRIASTQTKGA